MDVERIQVLPAEIVHVQELGLLQEEIQSTAAIRHAEVIHLAADLAGQQLDLLCQHLEAVEDLCQDLLPLLEAEV